MNSRRTLVWRQPGGLCEHQGGESWGYTVSPKISKAEAFWGLGGEGARTHLNVSLILNQMSTLSSGSGQVFLLPRTQRVLSRPPGPCIPPDTPTPELNFREVKSEMRLILPLLPLGT